MQLDFTPDQENLRDSVRAVLAKECPTTLVRAHVDHVVRGEPSTAGADLYRTLAALDWPALTVPESDGGVGLGVIELAILAEELGRVIAPGPLLPTVAGFVPVLREAGGASWLKAVASGEIAGSLAAADSGGAWAPDAVSAHVDGDGRLTGAKRYVLAVDDIDELAVVVRDGDGFAIVIVPKADLSIVPIRSLDASRSIGHVTLDGVRVAAERRLPVESEAIERATAEATVAFALELVGTCQSIFDTTLEYAKERHQFGVPIGSFQAVKHKLANMFVAIERARAVALFAAATIEEDDPRRPMATAMAKAAAGECQRLVASDGIQLLGGIGFTWEHDQHLFVKRAKATDALFGSAAEHRAIVADLLGI